MPQGVFVKNLVHRPAGLDREYHIEPIADLWILFNADLEIFAEQISGQLHHERKMITEAQTGHFCEDIR